MADGSRWRQGPLVVVAALLLGVLIAQIAVAGDSGDAKIASLQRQINRLNAKVSDRAQAAKKKKAKRGPAGSQGPQGPQGAPGTAGAPGSAPACQGNGSGDTMVAAGPVCIDKYEVSVWSSPTGGIEYGTGGDNYPALCTDTGQGCKAGTSGAIYARSIPGVPPSRYITWLQAQQALANVGKRLPSNAEWQQAVAGTPDAGPDNGTTDCKTGGASTPVNTGSRSACVSNFAANDMVGNLSEWVADWVPAAVPGTCPGWAGVSNDQMCLSSASTTVNGPGALVRGGFFAGTTTSGPLSVYEGVPSSAFSEVGFRGAR